MRHWTLRNLFRASNLILNAILNCLLSSDTFPFSIGLAKRFQLNIEFITLYIVTVLITSAKEVQSADMVFKQNSQAKKKQALIKIFQSLKLYAFSSYDKWKYTYI